MKQRVKAKLMQVHAALDQRVDGFYFQNIPPEAIPKVIAARKRDQEAG